MCHRASDNYPRRTPRGVRGLKPVNWCGCVTCSGRTPRGVRGLKLDSDKLENCKPMSHPAWGAWIETFDSYDDDESPIVAPRVGCVD